MEKKGFLLIFLSIIFLLVIAYNYKYDYSSLATDSGWDTSYDSGGYSSSSNDYSNNYDNDYDRDDDRDYNNEDDDESRNSSLNIPKPWNIIIAIAAAALPFVIIFAVVGFKDFLKLILGFVAVILGLYFLFVSPKETLIILGILFLISSIYLNIKDMLSKKKSVLKYTTIPKDEQLFINDCYKIFCDVQASWMNFDYDNLRRLVTDELFNMYQNQLETLRLKNQKNIMNDFELIGGKIVKRVNENFVETIEVNITTSFYDYVIDSNQTVIRGKKNKKVYMTYSLTFVRSDKAIDTCPNCNAHIEPNDTICPYCKSNIQSIRKGMKLSKKRVISQR